MHAHTEMRPKNTHISTHDLAGMCYANSIRGADQLIRFAYGGQAEVFPASRQITFAAVL